MPQTSTTPAFDKAKAIAKVELATGLFREQYFPAKPEDTRSDEVKLLEQKILRSANSYTAEVLAQIASKAFGQPVSPVAVSAKTAKLKFLVAIVPIVQFGATYSNDKNQHNLTLGKPYLVVNSKGRVRNGDESLILGTAVYDSQYRPATNEEIASLVDGLATARPYRTQQLFFGSVEGCDESED